MAKSNPEIEIKVAKFRTIHGLSESQPIDFTSLLLKLNVLTLFRPLSDNFSGMCLKDHAGNKFMLINSSNPIGRQRFTIAHELFHLFEEESFTPHICNPGIGKTPSEKNADAFAAVLLMPNIGLWELIPEKERISKNVSIATILKIEQYYSVSRSALLFRLQNIGAMNQANREQLSSLSPSYTAQQYGYDTSLYRPAHKGLVIGNFGEKARMLFEKGRISEGHYLELLNKISSNGCPGFEEN